eukprot:EG_transcript_2068
MALHGAAAAEPTYSRLMPVYDALDGRNYRQGLKLIQQALPKFPQSRILRALQCLALHRTDRGEEALAGLRELLALNQTDEAVLTPLALVLKAEEDWASLAEMYGKASAAVPSNQELAEQAFLAAARHGDGKEMQRLAQALHKRWPELRYQLWQVGSLYVQTIQSTPGQAPGLAGTLAAKMLERLFKDGKPLGQEAAMLYLDMLGDQDHHAEAIDFCCSAAGAAAFQRAGDRLEALRQLHVAAGRWPGAMALARRHIVETDRDGWDAYLGYIEALRHVLEPGPAPTEGLGEVTVPLEGEPLALPHEAQFGAAAEFLRGLRAEEEQNAGRSRRGPYLGVLELYRMAAQWRASAASQPPLPDAEELQGELRNSLLLYLSAFGTKPVCALDAMPYLAEWLRGGGADPASAAEALLAEVEGKLVGGVEGDDPAAQLKRLQGRLTVLKLRQCAGLFDHLSVPEAEALALTLLAEYRAALPLNRTLEKLEKGHGDDLVVLAVQLLVFHSQRHEQPHLLTKALWCLEVAGEQGRFNAYLLLLKALLYGRLGICVPEVLQAMDVKYIQLDTLGYLCLPAGRQAGHWGRVKALSQATTLFHRGCRATGPEDFAHAFQYGSLTKLREFRRFTDRLRRSVVAAECGVEGLLWGLGEQGTPDKAGEYLRAQQRQWRAVQEACRCEDLRSNEDLDVLDILIPRLRGSPEHQRCREALLPPALLPSPEAAVPLRAARCRLLWALLVALQVLIQRGRAAATPAQAKKAPKNKKKDGPSLAEPPAPELPCPSAAEALELLEEAWQRWAAASQPEAGPGPWRVAYRASAAGLATLDPDAAAAGAALEALRSEAAAAAAEAQRQCAESEAAGGATIGAYQQPLLVLRLTLSAFTQTHPFNGEHASLQAPFRQAVQDIAGLVEHLRKAAKALLGGPKDGLWTRLRPAFLPTTTPDGPDLEYGVRRVRAVVAEALHSFLAEADDALRDGAMELQAVLRSLG